MLRTKAKNAVPAPFVQASLRGLGAVRAARNRGHAVECPLCAGTYGRFIPFNGQKGVMCPRCRSMPRHRKMWLFFERTGILNRPARVLHVAPEPQLEHRLRQMKGIDYVSADLLRPEAMLRIDITRTGLQEGSFDAVICAHVFEHVKEDTVAMRELRRITRSGGWAILDAPVDWALEDTYEDWSITNPKDRRTHFGQWDHVRKYGRTYPDLLRAAGWNVEVDPLSFTAEEQERYGLGNDVIYWCEAS